MWWRHLQVLGAVAIWTPMAVAATIKVPADQPTLQAAVNQASAGDTIVVSAGIYRESIRLKANLTLRSAGDDAPDANGLQRAAATVIDGGGKAAQQPAVTLAEGCTLDGFTITNVGVFDQAIWDKHAATHGEELGDDEGAAGAEGTLPAVLVPGVNCLVTNCLVHDNGNVGIAVLGKNKATVTASIVANNAYRNLGAGIGVAEHAAAILRGNHCHDNLRAGIGCRQASPLIVDNVCYQNVRAGIGCREAATPVLRGNRCYENRRAGIGIRMLDTAPVVENNECSTNAFAGIGCRDEASPILRNNHCHHNKMAGIGCQDKAAPLIVDNNCHDNEMAGIGVSDHATATICRNQCRDNQLVAIGVVGESAAIIVSNELSRKDGMPPLLAIRDGSTATIQANTLTGGGVAALIVQGTATISANNFDGQALQPATAVWIWENSQVTIADNTFAGYRTAVKSAKSIVSVMGNTIKKFQGPAIIVKDSRKPAVIHGNTAISADPKAQVVDAPADSDRVSGNVIKPE